MDLQWLARYHTDNRYRPWLTVFILTSLTLVASFGITRLHIDPSNTQLFVRRSAAYQIYQQFRATFGSDETMLTVQATGNNYLLAHMSRSLVQTQIRSLVVALILVLGSITLALRSWKLGLVAAIPNVLPPLMIFGLMGWCGFELSTATTMIASVALGLIVDDTIHLLYHYHRAKRTGTGISDAIERSLLYTGRALITTTIILTLGFWTGMLGSFTPTLHFSFLTGLTMLFALLADLILVPAVLLTWKPSDAVRS